MQISKLLLRISFFQPAIPYMYLINWLSIIWSCEGQEFHNPLTKQGEMKMICNGHVHEKEDADPPSPNDLDQSRH